MADNKTAKAGGLADLKGWPLALTVLCAALALTVGLYFESAASAVDLWWNRSAYNHGFLIIPISLYLVWDKSEALAAMTPKPDVLGLIVIAGFSFAWVLARSAGINEGEHFALVGVIQGVVLAVLGRQLFLSMILPMAYLWLLVPTGTVFYPILQGAAHWISSTMLALSGIPVYSEGFLIEVPIGLYDVAPGCSGLNFILASLALAPLYGYMMYDGMRKRLLAIAVMLGVAVLANGMRIYGIIALAEFTDRRIDIIDDHLLYGWGFFAAVLALVGYIGSRFADPARPSSGDARAPAIHIARRKLITGTAWAMVVLAVFPLYRMAALTAYTPAAMRDFDTSGLGVEGARENAGLWQPDYPFATKTRLFTASRRGIEAEIYLAGYFIPKAAGEMITSGNDLTGAPSNVRAGSFSRRIESSGGSIKWHFVRLQSRGGDARLVARARYVEGAFVDSTLKAKLLQARATLLWDFQGSGVILVSVPVTASFGTASFDTATDDLVRFLEGVDISGLFAGTTMQSNKG